MNVLVGVARLTTVVCRFIAYGTILALVVLWNSPAVPTFDAVGAMIAVGVMMLIFHFKSDELGAWLHSGPIFTFFFVTSLWIAISASLLIGLTDESAGSHPSLAGALSLLMMSTILVTFAFGLLDNVIRAAKWVAEGFRSEK